jgi:hypothetical protein
MADIPPPTPPPGPPPEYPPPAPGYQPPPPQVGITPPTGPGYMPPPIGPTSSNGLNLGAQIAGAGWSIGVGAVSIVVPLVTAAFMGGNVFYFRILPLIGIFYAVRSIMRGFLIGGIIGIVLNIVGGIVSLTAMGLINPGI